MIKVIKESKGAYKIYSNGAKYNDKSDGGKTKTFKKLVTSFDTEEEAKAYVKKYSDLDLSIVKE